MISYWNPICPTTNERATLFCCSEDCALPTFACSVDCIYSSGHNNHRVHIWNDIRQQIWKASEISLSKQQVIQLDRHEKKLKILIEEFKAILSNHLKEVIQCKKRLQLKNTSKKVITLIQDRNTDSITGHDMAQFMKQIQKDNRFINYQSVQKAIETRNQLTEKLLLKLAEQVEAYKQFALQLPKPEQIPLIDSNFTIDPSNSKVEIENSVFTVKAGELSYTSVFGRQTIQNGQTFQIEVVDAANRAFMIGVAAADLRNSVDNHNHKNSLCVDARYGTLFADGQENQIGFELKTGDKVIVKRSQQLVEWLRNGQLLCSVAIPAHLINLPLFPVCWIRSWNYRARLKIS